MDKNERRKIADYFEERRGASINFKPTPHYIPAGDYLTIFFSDDFAYSERVDELLTVYRSEKSQEIVGCKIKGVMLLARNIVNILNYQDGEQEIEIRLLILTAVGSQPETPNIKDICKQVDKFKVPIKKIFPTNQAA